MSKSNFRDLIGNYLRNNAPEIRLVADLYLVAARSLGKFGEVWGSLGKFGEVVSLKNSILRLITDFIMSY
jgi:hypothetical protein